MQPINQSVSLWSLVSYLTFKWHCPTLLDKWDNTEDASLKKSKLNTVAKMFTLNAKDARTIMNPISLTWTDLASTPSCTLSLNISSSNLVANSKLPICIYHFSPRDVQVHSTPNISHSSLRLICSSHFDSPLWIETDHLPLPLSNLQAKAASVPLIPPSPPRLPPCVADGRDHEALGERLSAVLTHLFDKVRISAEKRLGLTASLLLTCCFHLPTRLMSWVTAQHGDTRFTYDVKNEGRQGDIIASLPLAEVWWTGVLQVCAFRVRGGGTSCLGTPEFPVHSQHERLLSVCLPSGWNHSCR